MKKLNKEAHVGFKPIAEKTLPKVLESHCTTEVHFPPKSLTGNRNVTLIFSILASSSSI